MGVALSSEGFTAAVTCLDPFISGGYLVMSTMLRTLQVEACFRLIKVLAESYALGRVIFRGKMEVGSLERGVGVGRSEQHCDLVKGNLQMQRVTRIAFHLPVVVGRGLGYGVVGVFRANYRRSIRGGTKELGVAVGVVLISKACLRVVLQGVSRIKKIKPRVASYIRL